LRADCGVRAECCSLGKWGSERTKNIDDRIIENGNRVETSDSWDGQSHQRQRSGSATEQKIKIRRAN